MGPIWDRQDPGGPHVGPMNFAMWESNGQWWITEITNVLNIPRRRHPAQTILPFDIMWCRADSRFAPSQWETALLCNVVPHSLGANIESDLWCCVYISPPPPRDSSYHCLNSSIGEREIKMIYIYNGLLKWIKDVTYILCFKTYIEEFIQSFWP